jgi:hypothetical protein
MLQFTLAHIPETIGKQTFLVAPREKKNFLKIIGDNKRFYLLPEDAVPISTRQNVKRDPMLQNLDRQR